MKYLIPSLAEPPSVPLPYGRGRLAYHVRSVFLDSPAYPRIYHSPVAPPPKTVDFVSVALVE